jgi:hypothetical protein
VQYSTVQYSAFCYITYRYIVEETEAVAVRSSIILNCSTHRRREQKRVRVRRLTECSAIEGNHNRWVRERDTVESREVKRRVAAMRPYCSPHSSECRM